MVKKIEKRIKVRFTDNRRVSLKKREDQKHQQKCMANNGVDMPEQLPHLLKDFGDDEDNIES